MAERAQNLSASVPPQFRPESIRRIYPRDPTESVQERERKKEVAPGHFLLHRVISMVVGIRTSLYGRPCLHRADIATTNDREYGLY